MDEGGAASEVGAPPAAEDGEADGAAHCAARTTREDPTSEPSDAAVARGDNAGGSSHPAEEQPEPSATTDNRLSLPEDESDDEDFEAGDGTTSESEAEVGRCKLTRVLKAPPGFKL